MDFLKLENSYKKNNEEYSINNSEMRPIFRAIKRFKICLKVVGGLKFQHYYNYKYIEAFNIIQLYMENKN